MADKNYGLATIIADVDEDQGQDAHASGTRVTDPVYGEGKVVFERYINYSAIVNFGFTLQAGWEGVSLMIFSALLNGGPAALVYGCIISGIGSTAVALSLGEMASMDPNVGAQYRWSALFAQSSPAFWGLFQGWITVFAWIASVATGLIGNATIMQGIIAFWSPAYNKQTWHVTLMMWAIGLAALICNLFLRRILNTLETIGGVCHVLFFVAFIVILTTLAERSTTEFVFKTVTYNLSGWNNPGLCFNIGMLSTLLPLTSCDAVLHMIDETKRPRKRVPKSMVASTVMNAIMMFAYTLTMLYCIGDYEAVVQSGLPIMEIYYQATKSKTIATVMMVLQAVVGCVSLFNIVASVSRLTWAFARDKGLPYANFFSTIHPKLQIPLPALGLVLTVCFLLSFVNIGSSVAFNAITSLTTLAVNISYAIPIYLLLMRKIAGKNPKYGPFRLGRWGIPINVLALLFCLYSIVWVPFPPIYPVNSQTMNYAGPITIVVMGLALLDWFATGKKRFQVPTSPYTIEMEERDNTKDDSN